MKRALVLAALAASATVTLLPVQTTEAATPAPTECRGLQACVSIVGPWVVVPVGATTPRPSAQWQLKCPRGYIVAGVDAQLTTAAIDVTFVATTGTPVAPGRTTSNTIVFVATYVGTGSPAPVFRPRAGCVPATGGGGRRTPTSVRAVVPPGKPTAWRVKTVRVDGTRSASVSCRAGERLVDSYASRAFRMAPPPPAGLVSGFKATSGVRGNRVFIRASSNDVRSVVQIAAVCAGGK